MWRESMMDLLDQLEAENPEDASLAPQEFPEWACIYIKYLQIFRRLEHAYDQMVHPQKLVDMKRALEACMGRLLEVRTWLTKLNRGLDFMNIDDILVDLKLTPGELEVPVPKYFKLDSAKVRCNTDTASVRGYARLMVVRMLWGV
jgi:IQ and AAA domain-containing protein